MEANIEDRQRRRGQRHSAQPSAGWGASLDALAGMPAVAGTDPELARLLARFADLNDFDRAALRRVIAMALDGM